MTHALTGRIIDNRYRLGPIIGRGATGSVFRATQLSLDREVAVKVLHNLGPLDSPESIARFRQEACAVSRLNHRGIVTVLDWGQDTDGLLYLVIEYLPGRDLFDIARDEAPLLSSRVARLMAQAARALSHAHDHGIVHRDLKPENIRVLDDASAPPDNRELVKIYDFGIARLTSMALASTHQGTMVGTPYYMSPEQATSGPISPQTDLYACGVIMFLLSTGRLPFMANSTLDLAAMHVRARVPLPSRINPAIDARLEQLILTCMAKRPAARPCSGVALATILDSIAESNSQPSSSSLEGSGREDVSFTTRHVTTKRQFARLSAVSVLSALLTFACGQIQPGRLSTAARAFGAKLLGAISVEVPSLAAARPRPESMSTRVPPSCPPSADDGGEQDVTPPQASRVEPQQQGNPQ